MVHRSTSILLAVLVLAACGQDKVTVQVLIPNERGVETPVAGARLAFLPYDRDSVLGALDNLAASPRPDTSRLDSLFQAFRVPFGRYLSVAADHERVSRARDSLTEAGANPESLQSLTDSLERLAPLLAAARRDLDAVRALMPAADSLRLQVAAWEDGAYAGYDSVTRALVRQSHRAAVNDSTGPAGWKTVELKKGRWWLYVRAININDPNAQWYWNVPVIGDTIILSPANGRSRPRLR